MLISRRTRERKEICPPPQPSRTQKMSLPSCCLHVAAKARRHWDGGGAGGPFPGENNARLWSGSVRP